LAVELWQGGAPYAQGDQTEDCPRLIPYLLKGKEPVGALIICPGGGYETRAARLRNGSTASGSRRSCYIYCRLTSEFMGAALNLETRWGLFDAYLAAQS
jgi:hypothetical protein